MITTKLYGGSNRTNEDCQLFLRDAYDLLTRLLKAYDLIEEYNNPKEIQSMPGISEQEIREAMLMDGISELVGMRIDSLHDMLMAGKFGDGVHLLRMKRALTYAEGLEASFQFMSNLVPETEELVQIKNDVEFAIGNWLYGFAYTIDLDTILECRAKQKEYRLDHEVANWISHLPIGEKVFEVLGQLKTKFIPIVEAFAGYPNEWASFVNSVPAEFKDDILMYAEQVYICDIIAYFQGQIAITEEYVQLLRDRKDNEMSVENQNPDILAGFIRKIPASYAYIMVTYANQITLEQMMDVINGNREIDAKFVADLKSRPDSMRTDAFDI